MNTNGHRPMPDMPRIITQPGQERWEPEHGNATPPPLPQQNYEASRPARVDLVAEIKRQLGLREEASGQAVLNAIGEIQAKEARNGRKVRLLAETLQQMVD